MGSDWAMRYRAALMNTFGPPQRVLVRGSGCWVWDDEGRRYLDLLGGIAVNSLGHAHPDLVAAISDQVATLSHVSNFFATPPQVELAERLLDLVGAPTGSRVFFANSGAEANEAAVKMSRRLLDKSGAPRARILALVGGFHGRTMGSLSVTHKPAIREPFAPLPGEVEFLVPGDQAALRTAFRADRAPVAAMFVEVMQGEAGVRAVDAAYLQLARELTTAAGALLVVDEVQTGIGRLGSWFAHHDPLDPAAGVRPDVVTLAKGLGGGFPIGAVVALGERAGSLLGPGDHGTTFGGNPLAARAALTVLHVIERDGLLAHAARMGELFASLLPGRHVRGAGLLRAIELPAGRDAADVVREALDAGLILNAVTPTAIRIAPPLVISEAQIRQAADGIERLLT